MKLCVLGATGNSGLRLVAEGLRRGHEVTAVARNPRDLASRFADAKVATVDFSSFSDLVAVMRGHDVVINAAGHVGSPDQFIRLVADVTDAASEALGPGGRFWMFAGAALLDVPGTDRMTVTLPGVPKIFAPHVANYRKAQSSNLAWSILCPGPMIDSPDGRAHDELAVSAEHWPVPRPAITRYLPSLATSLAFKKAIGRMTVYYEDAAKVILDNLGQDAFVGQRVGLALPEGMTLDKPGYQTRPEPR